jgi:hypothetical protein
MEWGQDEIENQWVRMYQTWQEDYSELNEMHQMADFCKRMENAQKQS